jgi:hypothetical protein
MWLVRRDLKKHLFGRYRKERKQQAAGVERSSRRSRSPAAEASRETSEERRQRIAEWTRKRKEGAVAATGGDGA